MRLATKLFNARALAVLLLGFSSGLPLALSGSTLQAWYTVSNVSIITIGMLALVGQPYIYKFLWAPIMDRYVPPLLGRRRGWILLMQLALAIVIAFMSFLKPNLSPKLLAGTALLVAFLSASQDISINAYSTDILHAEERGFGAALVTIGYRVAMIASGGLALIIAARYGWHFTYLLMAVLMLANTLITFFSPEVENHNPPPPTLKKAVIDPWREFMSRDAAIIILLFIMLYKMGDAFTVSLNSVFLLRGLHFSLMDVGTVNKMFGMASIIAGGLVGGIWLSRIGLFRSLWWFGIAQALCSLVYMAFAIIGKSFSMLVFTVFIDNFVSGLSGTSLEAFVMTMCNRKYTATQFALFSALTAIARVVVGPIAGLTIKGVGWTHFFLISFFVSIPGLVLLFILRHRYDARFDFVKEAKG